CFELADAGRGADRAPELWEEIETEGEQGTLAFYTAEDDAWTIARLNAAGQQKMAETAPDHCAEWQGLGVSILHRLVMDTLLDQPNLPAPKYVRAIEEVVDGLKQG